MRFLCEMDGVYFKFLKDDKVFGRSAATTVCEV